MAQRFSLYQDLTVRENLEFVALYGLPQPVRAAKAMVARLGLEGREEQIAGKLFGGWRQRLALGAWLPNRSCSTSQPPASTPRRGAISGAKFISCRWRPHRSRLHPLHGRRSMAPMRRQKPPPQAAAIPPSMLIRNCPRPVPSGR
jgi:hypothetical protein